MKQGSGSKSYFFERLINRMGRHRSPCVLVEVWRILNVIESIRCNLPTSCRKRRIAMFRKLFLVVVVLCFTATVALAGNFKLTSPRY